MIIGRVGFGSGFALLRPPLARANFVSLQTPTRGFLPGDHTADCHGPPIDRSLRSPASGQHRLWDCKRPLDSW